MTAKKKPAPRRTPKPAAEEPNPLEAVVAGAEQIPAPGEEAPPPKPLDGVFVVIERDEEGKISNMQFAANGDVRPTEIGDILRLAESVHSRQIKG